jgi:flavorubredoxin/flavin reductase (DIM6/NTAB) family NADH-FMN oxidoreductase RutF
MSAFSEMASHAVMTPKAPASAAAGHKLHVAAQARSLESAARSAGGVAGSKPLPEILTATLAAASGTGLAARARASKRRGNKMPRKTVLAARGGEAAQDLSEVEMWTGLTPGKDYRLQTMSVQSVADNTSTIRSLDWDRDRFDIEFALERGTTYNSYIIKGSEKTAVVDTSHEKFEKLYFDALNKEVDLATVNYLVCSHTEPDHSGLIGKLLQLAKEAGNEDLTVVGSKMCIQFLENLIFEPFKRQVVANANKIDLGGGHELEFVIAPNLHWPDTMFTFDHGTGVLYTCDAFGMHYCSDDLKDVEGVKELLPHYALYYECLMKPNARSVLSAMKKIGGFDVKSIATGHGPMLTEFSGEWMGNYQNWSEKATANQGPSVALFWTSNFAQSERLSQLFAHGLTSNNVDVEMHDLSAVDIHDITEVVGRASVLAIMAPPSDSDASANIANIIANAKPKKHQFMIVDSFGGKSQESVALLRNRLNAAEIPEAMPAMEVKDENSGMTPQIMQGFEEAGMFLGRKLTQREKAAAARGQDKDLAKAVGRIAQGLYVATAKKSGVRHAMVASWVSPVSTEPLALQLTIAKDRAMEPLLRIGDSFTINILEEGNPETLKLTKHFLQKFAPGVDRLEGVDCFEGSNGAAVLRGACAYVECKILSRMDASDHWIGYAEVIGGNVAKQDATAAVHHRKIGTYY